MFASGKPKRSLRKRVIRGTSLTGPRNDGPRFWYSEQPTSKAYFLSAGSGCAEADQDSPARKTPARTRAKTEQRRRENRMGHLKTGRGIGGLYRRLASHATKLPGSHSRHWPTISPNVSRGSKRTG